MANPAVSNGEKLDQILVLLADLNGRFNGHVETSSARFGEIDQRLGAMDKRLGEIDKRLADMKQESKQELRDLRNAMLKLHDAQLRKVDLMDQNMRAFRDELLTTMDFIRKDYDSFQEDRMMTHAGLDRLQHGQENQNETTKKQFAELTARVARLEAAIS